MDCISISLCAWHFSFASQCNYWASHTSARFLFRNLFIETSTNLWQQNTFSGPHTKQLLPFTTRQLHLCVLVSLLHMKYCALHVHPTSCLEIDCLSICVKCSMWYFCTACTDNNVVLSWSTKVVWSTLDQESFIIKILWSRAAILNKRFIHTGRDVNHVQCFNN